MDILSVEVPLSSNSNLTINLFEGILQADKEVIAKT